MTVDPELDMLIMKLSFKSKPDSLKATSRGNKFKQTRTLLNVCKCEIQQNEQNNKLKTLNERFEE